jgi:hypothetical protein
VDPVKVEMANHFWNIDWAKAKRELKFRPRSPEQTVRDTVDWLREHQDEIARAASGSPSSSSSSRKSDAADPEEADAEDARGDDDEEEDSTGEKVAKQLLEKDGENDDEEDEHNKRERPREADRPAVSLRAKL